MGDSNPNWKSRLRYFRCHSIVNGRCTCGNDACGSPGKHPKRKNWQQEALTSTPEQIAEWRKDPTINLGIFCGPESDIFFLDVEVTGLDTFIAMTREHGNLPTTYTVRTGGGGCHYGFKHPTTHTLQNKVKFQPDHDIRTTGGLVIAAGGRHISGGTYEVTIDSEPVAAPTWLLDLIVEGQQQKNSKKKKKAETREPMLSRLPDVVPEGQRDDTLFRYGCYLRGQRGRSQEEILEDLLVANRERCKPPLPDGEVRKLAGQAAQYEAHVALDDSDQALTESFATAESAKLRYLIDDRSWRGFDQKSGLYIERPSGPIYEIGEHVKGQEPPTANRALHKRLNSEKIVAAVLRLAKDRPEFRALAQDFDPDPWLLGLPGGLVLDLQTGEIRGAQPSDLLMRALPVAPSDKDQKAACPRWLQYLDEVHPNDPELHAYLQRFFGYSLTASICEECVVFFIGRGGSGKNTCYETIQAAFGSYCCQLPLDLLLEDSKEDRRLNHIANLLGKRLGICNEGARSKKLDRNTLKNLSGGGNVTGRRLGHQAFEFPMQAKILIVANDPPVLDLDEAMKQRVHVVPFNVVFRGDPKKENKGLKDYFKAHELPGILRWAVDGCLAWQREGLKPPPSVVARTTEYFVSSDLLDQFLEESCEFSPEFFGETTGLFQAAKRFCEERGEKTSVTVERLFVADLKQRMEQRKINLEPDRPRGNGYSGKSGFWGIRLKSQRQEPPF